MKFGWAWRILSSMVLVVSHSHPYLDPFALIFTGIWYSTRHNTNSTDIVTQRPLANYIHKYESPGWYYTFPKTHIPTQVQHLLRPSEKSGLLD
ncbi:hypothetical protein V8F20_009572 [Naviculisporaceae sp. PSN 640]